MSYTEYSVFIEFTKMARLSRECIITEKIDGTNAQISITEHGDIFVGSRTRWITPQNDNYGFAAWVDGNKNEILKLGPGRHFGEWWGCGIQRGYNLKEKRLSLFNVTRWCLHNEPPCTIPSNNPKEPVKIQQQLPECVGLVPLLYRGEFKELAWLEALSSLALHGSKASPGFMNPEGVVVYHVAAGVGFKKTIEKDDLPKSKT